ncbi:hypothetical protein PLESTB_000031500 [Pleodorina starrii]|uniref:Uncharacterized protein n=1 Tax=Pleodorina starrii TaxID=330485 RepID=A0A9W6BA27_9CHLO|nr:hypothetical protein PLESTM_001102800 [Pleodorina starrii]GLC47842.1 hypothetical protein PLESTB_000031500 [Pleodorina starrii]GLC70733.1 hypothetical protein PLESTF_001027600 [Pleodorina starrii]
MESLLGRRVRVPPDEWGLRDGDFWGVIVQLGLDTSGKQCVGIQLDGGDLFYWPAEMASRWLLGTFPAPKRPRRMPPEGGHHKTAGQQSGPTPVTDTAKAANVQTENQQSHGFPVGAGSNPAPPAAGSHGGSGPRYSESCLQVVAAEAGHQPRACGDAAGPPVDASGQRHPSSKVATATPPEPNGTSAALISPPSQSRTPGQVPNDGRKQHVTVTIANGRLAQIHKLRALERLGRDGGAAAACSRCLIAPPKPALMLGSSGRDSSGGDGGEAAAAGPGLPGVSLPKGVLWLLNLAQGALATSHAAGQCPEGDAAPGTALPQRPSSDGRSSSQSGVTHAGTGKWTAASRSSATTTTTSASHPPRSSPDGGARGPAVGSGGVKRSAPDNDEDGNTAAERGTAGQRSAGVREQEEERRPAGRPQSARVERTGNGAAAEQQSGGGGGGSGGGGEQWNPGEQRAAKRSGPDRGTSGEVNMQPGPIPFQLQASTAPVKPPLSSIQPQAAAQPRPTEARPQQPLPRPARGSAGAGGGGGVAAAVCAVTVPKNGAAALAAGIPLGCHIY